MNTKSRMKKESGITPSEKPQRTKSHGVNVRIAVGDCETDPFKRGRIPKPFVWGYYDGTEFWHVKTFDEFLARLREQSLIKHIVYFHNGGKFDFHFMFDKFVEFMPLTIINNRLVRFVIGNVEFRDSFAILPFALGKYKKTKIDYANFEVEKRLNHMDEIVNYMRDDCVNTFELVSAFVTTYGTSLTVAGAAMKYWQGMKEVPMTASSRLDDLMRPWYYGGRVEVFKQGWTGPVSVVDINSAYPHAMLHPHAYGHEYVEADPDIWLPQDFYEVTCDSAGALPYRGEDGSLSFPHGRYKFLCTGHELLMGFNLNLITRINVTRRISFLELTDFKDYVNHFYELKKNSKKGTPEYIFSKLMMNSLYGKFGMDPSEFVEYSIADPAYSGALYTEGKLAGFLGPWAVAESEAERKMYYNVATAASITGFVRAKLLHAIAKSKGVVYCDTDSIIATVPEVFISPELGDWTDEGTGEGWIAAKKIYALKMRDGSHKIASKGVKFNYEEVEKLCKGESVEWESEIPSFSLSREPTFIKREINVCRPNSRKKSKNY